MNDQHIELWDKAETKNHSYWNFYALIVVAIAGWLFAKGNDIELLEKIIISVGFVVFSYFNLMLIMGTARLLEAVSAEITKSAASGNSDSLSEHVANSIGKNRALSSVILQVILHLIIDMGVITAIWT